MFSKLQHWRFKKNFEKYVIRPLKQAYRTYQQILANNKDTFGKINKVYICSISSHAFPKVAKENLTVTKEMIAGNDNKIKGIDYIGLDDFEAIAYAIENYEKTIFSLMNDKIIKRNYLKYDGYFFHTKKYRLGNIKWHQDILDDTIVNAKLERAIYHN